MPNSETGTSKFWNSLKPETVEKQAEGQEKDKEDEESVETPEVVDNQPTEEAEDTKQETSDETEQEDGVYYSFETIHEEPETVEVEEEEAKVPEKVSYDVKDYINTNKEKLREYLKLSDLDVDSLERTELLSLYIKRENPYLSDEDVKEELKDRYGIGLKLKEIPEDALDSEIEKIEAYNEKVNEKIKKGERLLKGDIQKAKQSLNSAKESLEVPELSFEFDTSQKDPKKIVEKYLEDQSKEQEKYKTEVWLPTITEAVNKVGGFIQKFEIDITEGDKVVSDFTYKLSEKQKQTLLKHLENYQGNPEDDSKYVIDAEKGQYDLQRFVGDQAKKLFAEDVTAKTLKEGFAKMKEHFVKNYMVNYNPNGNTRSTAGTQSRSKDRATGFFQASASARK